MRSARIALNGESVASPVHKATGVARRARPGERLVTLDDVERVLDPEMLVIADGEKPVAVAGIMGGGPTEVGDATRNVLLETANFLPATIRKTSAALRLPSEASRRYERGIDPDLALRASQRTVALLAQIAGGTPPSDIVDVYPGQTEPRRILVHEDDNREARQLLTDAGLAHELRPDE